MYSGKETDIGNNHDGVDLRAGQFGLHMRFFIEQLFRVMKPGCNVCIHIQQLLRYKVQHGFMGLRDFRGSCLAMFEEGGFQPHGEFVIVKNPQAIAQRMKLHSLMFVTGKRNARKLAPAVNDYVLIFQKPGECEEPVPALYDKAQNPGGWITQEEWIRDAHGIWAVWDESAKVQGVDGVTYGKIKTDIMEIDTLEGYRNAKESEEEKHVCLAKNTLVLTRNGYIPIQDVMIGDMVLTHQGRWRPVMAVACTGTKPVRKLIAQGVPGLTLTADHRLWARDVRGYAAKRAAAERYSPDWLRADAASDCYVNSKLPPVEDSPLTEDEWWIVGRWLADGHIGARGELVISIGYHKLEAFLSKAVQRAGTIARHKTAAQVRIRDRDCHLRSIIERCGRGAHGKVVPGEALTLEVVKAKALLDGYLSGDGHLVPGRERWMATTVSRPLALGMALVAQRAYGAVPSVGRGKQSGTTVIEGRTVNTSDEWVMSFELPRPDRHNKPFILDDGAWKKVRSIEDAGEAEVWDITVDEDHSFTAEGCIVENCPLQLEVIRRCMRLYTNPGELVLDPFMGIGSTAYVAIEQGRRCVGFELKESYHRMALANVAKAIHEKSQTERDLFSVVGGER